MFAIEFILYNGSHFVDTGRIPPRMFPSKNKKMRIRSGKRSGLEKAQCQKRRVKCTRNSYSFPIWNSQSINDCCTKLNTQLVGKGLKRVFQRCIISGTLLNLLLALWYFMTSALKPAGFSYVLSYVERRLTSKIQDSRETTYVRDTTSLLFTDRRSILLQANSPQPQKDILCAIKM